MPRLLTSFARVAAVLTLWGCRETTAPNGGTPPLVVPAPPSGVAATPGISTITLEWAAPAGATSFNVYWTTSEGVTPVTGTKIVGVTSPFVHTGRANGDEYHYVITALNAAGESAPSAEVRATAGATTDQRLYVVNHAAGFFATASVASFAAGASGNIAPSTVIIGGNTGLYAPIDAVVEAAGGLRVANQGSPVINVFAPGADGDATPIASIAGEGTGLQSNAAVALDADGRLFVASHYGNRITVYAPDATGNAAPVASIAGDNTGIQQPSSLAFDSEGRLYVANQGNSSVTVYAAGASGDVAPIATIAGASTRLQVPGGLAVDATGRLYVGNYVGGIGSLHRITIYAAGATGDVAPVASIEGPNTQLAGGIALAFDAAGRLFVANYATHSITFFAPGATGDVAPIGKIAGDRTRLSNPSAIRF